MVISFYKYSGDPRVANKTLGAEIARIESPRIEDDCTITNPHFCFAYNALIANCNYMYVDDWGRYYRMDPVTVDDGKRMYVSGTVDAVLTYWDQIKTSPAIATRYSAAGISKIPDPNLPIATEYDSVYSIVFGKDGTENDLLKEIRYNLVMTVK